MSVALYVAFVVLVLLAIQSARRAVASRTASEAAGAGVATR
jgi:hypothetical protein